MQYQPNTDNPGFWEKAEGQIEDYKPGLVQRMKTDTAASWIIDGVGQQMVQVDYHSSYHQQIGPAPVAAEEGGCD